MEMEAAVMVEGTQVEVAREEAALVAVAMGVEEGQVAPTVATVAVAMRVEVMGTVVVAERAVVWRVATAVVEVEATVGEEVIADEVAPTAAGTI